MHSRKTPMPDKKVIHWLADPDNPIPEALGPAIEQQGFEWCAFRAGDAIPAVLFVFSPVWNGFQYLSIEGIWAKYLAQDYPTAKLIVVGNQESMDANFVDVLQWPNDLAAFIEQAQEAGRFKSEMPVFTGGVDMTERMKRFLKGHGNESMASICNDIHLNLVPGPGILKRTPHLVHTILEVLNRPIAKNNWKTLSIRWINYQPFFGYLPFYAIFSEMGQLMESMRPYFEDEDTNTDNIEQWFTFVLPCLERLKQLLKKLEEYVR